MKGSLFAFFGGAFITLQGVVNAHISNDIGNWQTAALTQCTGFVVAFLILLLMKDKKWKQFKQVKPLYLIGGSFGAVVVFSNIQSIHKIGVTITIAVILIAQLLLTFLIDSNGWFDVIKQKMRLPQFIGLGMMVIGVVVLSM